MMSTWLVSDALHRRLPQILSMLILPLFLAALPVSSSPAKDGLSVGIYWDSEYADNTLVFGSLPQTLVGHLVVQGETFLDIIAWELALEIEGPATITSWNLVGQATNAETSPVFSVRMAEPLASSSANLLLATFECVVTGADPVTLSVRPLDEPLLPGRMAVVNDVGFEMIRPLVSATGRPEVAWTNPGPRTDVSDLDFGFWAMGGESTHSFTFMNDATDPVDLDITLAGACPGFSLPGVSGPVTLAGQEYLEIPVLFAPESVGPASCEVTFGIEGLSVGLTGTGMETVVLMSYPTLVDWGETSVRVIYSSQNFTVSNHGTVPQAISPVVTSCPPSTFSIQRGGETRILDPGDQVQLLVSFTPSEPIPYSCELSLAPELRPITLTGLGVAASEYYQYSVPNEVDFGEVRAGQYVDLYVRISNEDWHPLPIDPSLSGCNAQFEIRAGGQQRYVGSYGNDSVLVRFQPQSLGDVHCLLQFAPWLEPVPIRGRGLVPDGAWSITPSATNIPLTPAGEISETPIEVCNTGTTTLDLAPVWDGSATDFTFADGGQPEALAPGACRTVTVRFAPTSPGYFPARLVLGVGLPALPVIGATGVVPDSCGVDVTTLDFGSIAANQTQTRPVRVTNTSEQVLEIRPQSDSPRFVVSGFEGLLQPGETAALQVEFVPEGMGEWTGTITTGHPMCAEVFCAGDSYHIPSSAPDRLGVYFNGSFTENEVQLGVGEVVEGAIVLLNPSSEAGVQGWECTVGIEGDAILLDWNPEGQALNIAQPPEFVVGLSGPPLPYAEAIRLATFRVIVLADHEPTFINLVPTSVPSIPDRMAWSPRDANSLIALTTVTGVPTVAAINGSVAADIPPAPAADLHGAIVQLTWSAPVSPGAGYLVYRRVGNAEPMRLTAAPISAVGGAVTYTDPVVDFAAGTDLYYSYTKLQDGVESAHSDEVKVTLGLMPRLTTRLLPNIPNPFNPVTEIRFEMARAGQVRVAIYDVSGRLVRTLANEWLEPGLGSRAWQGLDDSGRPVASGAYYVRLSSEGKIDHRKVMLLK